MLGSGIRLKDTSEALSRSTIAHLVSIGRLKAKTTTVELSTAKVSIPLVHAICLLSLKVSKAVS